MTCPSFSDRDHALRAEMSRDWHLLKVVPMPRRSALSRLADFIRRLWK